MPAGNLAPNLDVALLLTVYPPQADLAVETVAAIERQWPAHPRSFG